MRVRLSERDQEAGQMASDSYRMPGSPTSPTHSTASLPNGRPRPYTQSPPPIDAQGPGRSRGPSTTRSDDSRQTQSAYPRSMNDAVSTAFDHAKATSGYDPALIAQIKAEVLNDLKAEMRAEMRAESLSDSKAHAQRSVDSQRPQSPLSSSASIPARYTPPSPVRVDDVTPRASGAYVDPDGANDWRDLPPTRYAEASETSVPQPASEPVRPKPVARTSTGDATTLEKIWQPLFDADGNPTERLSQVLRGLALNLIEDYQPVKSLVISPAKMLRFYTEHRVPGEVYPFDAVFGGKMSNSSLSHLYRDLGCQHHFIQPGIEDKPCIPALTPAGFDCWITHFIRAHPDIEFERLTKAILDLPISNADDRKERFPKEVSRRLFPRDANLKVQDNLIACMTDDPVIQLTPAAQPAPTQTNYPPPPPPQHSSNTAPQPMPPPPSTAPPPARNTFPVSASVPADEYLPSGPIERERKPYSAQPGGGKVYDDGTGNQRQEQRTSRANTVASSQRPVIVDPDDYLGGNLRHVRTSSTVDGQRPWTQRSPSRNRGNTTSYTRSEADVSFGSYGGGPATLHIDDEELGRRYSRDERPRRYAEDDNYRTYATSQTGSQSGRGYEEDYYRRGAGGSLSSSGYPPPPPQQYPPPPRYG